MFDERNHVDPIVFVLVLCVRAGDRGVRPARFRRIDGCRFLEFSRATWAGRSAPLPLEERQLCLREGETVIEEGGAFFGVFVFCSRPRADLMSEFSLRR